MTAFKKLLLFSLSSQLCIKKLKWCLLLLFSNTGKTDWWLRRESLCACVWVIHVYSCIPDTPHVFIQHKDHTPNTNATFLLGEKMAAFTQQTFTSPFRVTPHVMFVSSPHHDVLHLIRTCVILVEEKKVYKLYLKNVPRLPRPWNILPLNDVQFIVMATPTLYAFNIKTPDYSRPQPLCGLHYTNMNPWHSEKHYSINHHCLAVSIISLTKKTTSRCTTGINVSPSLKDIIQL